MTVCFNYPQVFSLLDPAKPFFTVVTVNKAKKSMYVWDRSELFMSSQHVYIYHNFSNMTSLTHLRYHAFTTMTLHYHDTSLQCLHYHVFTTMPSLPCLHYHDTSLPCLHSMPSLPCLHSMTSLPCLHSMTSLPCLHSMPSLPCLHYHAFTTMSSLHDFTP